MLKERGSRPALPSTPDVRLFGASSPKTVCTGKHKSTISQPAHNDEFMHYESAYAPTGIVTSPAVFAGMLRTFFTISSATLK